MYPYLSPHELAAIGSVCSAWAHVENLIDETIASLRSTKNSNVRAPLPQRLKLLEHLAAKKLDERDRAALRAICDQIHHHSKERNVVIHADWVPEDREGLVANRESPSGGVLGSRYGERTTASIFQLAQDVLEIGDRIDRFLFATGMSPDWEKTKLT